MISNLNDPGLSASFTYDPFGRRVTKTINGTTTNLLYDRSAVVEEIVGGTLAAAMLASLSIDETLIRTDALGSHVVLSDSLGSTVGLGNTSTGAVETQYTYEPYGSTSATGTSNNNPLRFTGREDDGTGLYY